MLQASQNFDGIAAQFYQSLGFHGSQQTADCLPVRVQFVSDLLMGDMEYAGALRFGPLLQVVQYLFVEIVKRNEINHSKQLGKAIGIGGVHKLAPFG